MAKNLNFKRYVDSVGGRQAAAENLGVSRALVDHMVNGIRNVSVPIAKLIVEKSKGAFALHEFRPDVWDAPAEKPAKTRRRAA